MKGQISWIVIVYGLVALVLFAALVDSLQGAIGNVFGSSDSLTALVLSWFTPLAFLIVVYALVVSFRPFPFGGNP